MATTVARLQAVLSAQTRDFDQAMGKSEGRMRRVGKGAAVMTGIVGGALVLGLKKSVNEAMDAERAQARLEKAFSENVKGGLKPYTEQIGKASKAAIQLGFDDEDLADSLGSLVIATGDYNKAQNASNVAMDLARFKGIDLEQATKMMTMAMAGSQRATKQLGITVPTVTTTFDELKARFTSATSEGGKTITMTEKLALENAKLIDKQKTAGNVIDIVSQKVKGQAAAYAETTEGGIKVFQEQMEEMREQIGAAILPALNDVVGGLTKILEFFQKHPTLGKAVLLGLTGLLAAATAAQIALNIAILANPYVAATLGILALSAGIAIAWVKFKQLRDVIAALLLVWGPLMPLILVAVNHFDDIKEAVSKAWNAIKNLAEWFSNHKEFLAPGIAQFKLLLGFLEKVKDAFGWIIGNVGKIAGAISGAAGKIPTGDPRSPAGAMGPVGAGAQGLVPGILDELAGARAMGLTLTSGVRHTRTRSGAWSDHHYGKAIDVAGAPANMARFFRWLIGQTDVKQAFYDPLGSVFRGVLSSYREGGHSDHVHVATYDKGGWLMPGLTLAQNNTGRPEAVGFPGDINLYVDGHKLFSWIKDAEKKDRRRNGR